jgi:hypothetical protein
VEPIHDALCLEGESRDPLVDEVLLWLQLTYSDTRTTYLNAPSDVLAMMRRVVLFLRSGLSYVETTSLSQREVPPFRYRGCLLFWPLWISPRFRRIDEWLREVQVNWFLRAADKYWPFVSEEQYEATLHGLGVEDSLDGE